MASNGDASDDNGHEYVTLKSPLRRMEVGLRIHTSPPSTYRLYQVAPKLPACTRRMSDTKIRIDVINPTQNKILCGEFDGNPSNSMSDNASNAVGNGDCCCWD